MAEAKRADKEARKLAKTLSPDGRAAFEATTAPSLASIRSAREERRARPRRAERMARRAAAQLELASIRATASGDAERWALAERDAKKRAKTIKRRRAQAKQANKMAKFVALHAVVASVTTPTDQEQTEKKLKRVDAAHGARLGRPPEDREPDWRTLGGVAPSRPTGRHFAVLARHAAHGYRDQYPADVPNIRRRKVS